MSFPPANDPALQALAHVAEIATAKCGIPIVLVPQYDAQVCWGAAAVHPMQALETEYQAIVRDAGRQPVSDPSPLIPFYFLESGAPKLLGVERDRPYRGQPIPLPADLLQHADSTLRILEDMSAVGLPAERLAPYITHAPTAAMRVYDEFLPLAVPLHAGDPPISIADVPALIAAPRRVGDVAGSLRTAIASLRDAMSGNASVQMLYTIEPFYLSRLLIRYRVRAVHPVKKEDAMVASGALTSILNAQPWLVQWLEQAIIGLDAAIKAVDPHHHTRFFLKGGRAIAYFDGNPALGRNDWDTQVLIDPNLPPREWYALYRDISNAILLHLLASKNAFFSTLAVNAEQVRAIPRPAHPDPPDPLADASDEEEWVEFDEAVDPLLFLTPGFQYPCKAELIDVGMPRRDTIELREQWAELHDGIIASPLFYPEADPNPPAHPATMPIPTGGYYVTEYITMIREFFAGEGASAAKTRKRVERLATMLREGRVAAIVVVAMMHLPATIRNIVAHPLAASLAPCPADAAGRANDAAYVLLDQIATAYAMHAEPELQTQFAIYYAHQLGHAHVPAEYAPAFRNALPPDTQAMTDCIGFAAFVADQLAEHAAARAALIALRRAQIVEFLGALFDRSVFDGVEEYQLQLAVGGSFAAMMQAEYHRMPNGNLEATSLITIGLYHSGVIDPRVAIALIAPIVDECLADFPLFTLGGENEDVLRLFWATPHTLHPFQAYHPLVIEIVPIGMRERPLINSIRRLPVLGLRDLIVEYQQRSARVVEYRRRRQLRTTAALLTDMLMAARA